MLGARLRNYLIDLRNRVKKQRRNVLGHILGSNENTPAQLELLFAVSKTIGIKIGVCRTLKR